MNINPSFSDITMAAIEAAKNAGKILEKGFASNSMSIINKPGNQNIVTEYDLKSEALIIESIQKKFPSHTFLSEEAGLIGNNPKEVQWVIDPLDGTSNFAHKIPFFVISIAARKNNTTLTGVIYNPLSKDLFIAEKNKGAFLNEKKINVSKTEKIEKAFIGTGIPHDIDKNLDIYNKKFINMVKKGTSIRKMGAAALEIAYVAMGCYDGYWVSGLHPWDTAAAIILLEEAKGKVTDWKNKPFDIINSKTIVCSNYHIHDQMTNILQK